MGITQRPFWELLPWWECSSCACLSLTCPCALPSQIMADLLANGIDVYPQKEFDEDSEDRLVNEKFRVSAGALPWRGPAAPGAGDLLGLPLQKASVFFPRLLCPVHGVCPAPGVLPELRAGVEGEGKRMGKVSCACSFPISTLSRGSMAPCPAPGSGNRGACPPLARPAAFPALGWNCTSRLPAAGSTMLWEADSNLLSQ